MKYNITQSGYKIAKNGHDVLRLELQPDVFFHARVLTDKNGRQWEGNVFVHTRDGDTFCADTLPIVTAPNKEALVAWVLNNPNQIRFAVIRAKYRANNNIK